MKPTSSSPKQDGAATAAATGSGAEEKDSGSIGLQSSASELAHLAKEGEPKALNEKLMEQGFHQILSRIESEKTTRP